MLEQKGVGGKERMRGADRGRKREKRVGDGGRKTARETRRDTHTEK